MAGKGLGRRGLVQPAQTAALLGLAATLATGVHAAPIRDAQDRPVSAQTDGPRDVMLRVEDGRLFISQGGHDLGELPIADTADAASLKALLTQDGAPQTRRLAPFVVADGGGGSAWLRPPTPPNLTAGAAISKASSDAGPAAAKTAGLRAAKADMPAAPRPKPTR